MNKKILIALLFLCAVGLFLSGYLTKQHFVHLEDGLKKPSICNINDYINCDIVTTSNYATIFSIPIAGIGFLFYLVISIFSILGLITRIPKKGGLFLCWVLSCFGLIFTIYTAVVSLVLIKALCLFCLGMYLTNILILILIPLAIRIPLSQLPQKTLLYIKKIFDSKVHLDFEPRLLLNSLIIITIFAFGIFFLATKNYAITHKPAHQLKSDSVWKAGRFYLAMGIAYNEYWKQPPMTYVVPGNTPVWGNPEAKIVIVEFSDFQCPFCKKAKDSFEPLLKPYKENVAFYFVNYPLDQACNPNIQKAMHPHACDAAKASLCAHDKGKFWEFHDLQFDHQDKISEYQMVNDAESLGLNRDDFIACMTSEQIENALAINIAFADKINIRGTPSIYINGRKLEGWTNPKLVQMILDEEVKRSK